MEKVRSVDKNLNIEYPTMILGFWSTINTRVLGVGMKGVLVTHYFKTKYNHEV